MGLGNTSIFVLTMGASVLTGWVIMKATTPSPEKFRKKLTPAQIEAEEEYRRELLTTLKAIHNSGIPVWFLEREIKKLKQKQAKEEMEAKIKKAKERAKEKAKEERAEIPKQSTS